MKVNFLQNTPISRLLVFMYVIFLVSIGIMRKIEYQDTEQLLNGLNEISKSSAQKLSFLISIHNTINYVQEAVLKHLISSNKEEVRGAEIIVNSGVALNDRNLNEYQKMVTGKEEQILFDKLKDLRAVYTKALKKTLQLCYKGGIKEAVNYYNTVQKSTFENFNNATIQFSGFVKRDTEIKLRNADHLVLQARKRSDLINIIILLLLVFLGGIVLKAVKEIIRDHLLLAESEKKYRNLFNFSPLPLWVAEPDTFTFLDVNEAAVKHYGYSREEFLAMTLQDIRPAEDIKLFEEVAAQNRSSGSTFFQGVFRHKKKNGEIIQVQIQRNFINFNNQKAELVLAEDITERMEYLSAIEEQNKTLREIAWTQSHIVRAPLARMMGLIYLINHYNRKEIDQNELLLQIYNSGKDLDAIIRDIVKKTETTLYKL